MQRYRFAVVVVGLMLAAALSVGAQRAFTPVAFFITFIPNIQFSPIYVAIEKGYFAQAGLDVTIEHGDEPIGVNLVAAGERPFAMISGEQVIAARANGRPVVSIYEWFQKYPVGIVVAEDSPIETVADLRGRRIGIPGLFGASYTGAVALLAANGLTEQDVRLDPIGFNAPQVFCTGAIEASVVYINNEPLQIDTLARRGECGSVTGTRVFSVSDYVDMVSNGIITSERLIAENPEMVSGFVTAYHQGLVDVMNNPAEAYLLTLPYVESLARDPDLIAVLEAEAARLSDPDNFLGTFDAAEARDSFFDGLVAALPDGNWTQMRVLLNTIALWEAPSPGLSDADSWRQTQDTLLGMRLLSRQIDVEAAFTNDFVPKG